MGHVNTLVIEFLGVEEKFWAEVRLMSLPCFKIHFPKKGLISQWQKNSQNLMTGDKREDNKNYIRRPALLHLYLFILPCTCPVSGSAWGSPPCLCLMQWPQVWEHWRIHKTHVRTIPGGAGKATIILYNHVLHTALNRKQWRIPREVIQSHFSLSSLI